MPKIKEVKVITDWTPTEVKEQHQETTSTRNKTKKQKHNIRKQQQ